MNKIELNHPKLKGNEKKYLIDCINSNWLSGSGSYVKKFENKILSYTKSKYSAAIINGTSALQLAIKIVGCNQGDEVVVPTISFIAPINAVIYNNCSPVFMDADDYFNIDENKCINFIKKETYFKNGSSFNKKTNKKISAIIVVHVWGNAANIINLVKICKERNIKIVEDASESLGTKYLERHRGAHTGLVGDIGCISFNTNKIITCGSGGIIIANNKKYISNAKYLSTQSKDNSIYYIHNSVGYNFRLNNLNAAVGLAQMEQLKSFIKHKKQNFINYKKYFLDIEGLEIIDTPSYARNNHWINVLKVNRKFGISVKIILNFLLNNNVEVRPVWYLNHKQKMFKNYQSYNIVNAFKLLNNSICLPSSVGLKKNDIKTITNLIKNIKN